jgi:hypothetical protein
MGSVQGSKWVSETLCTFADRLVLTSSSTRRVDGKTSEDLLSGYGSGASSRAGISVGEPDRWKAPVFLAPFRFLIPS